MQHCSKFWFTHRVSTEPKIHASSGIIQFWKNSEDLLNIAEFQGFFSSLNAKVAFSSGWYNFWENKTKCNGNLMIGDFFEI